MAHSNQEPRWVTRVVIDAVHTDMLLTHGGLPGLRDEDLLESALARPRQKLAYEPPTDLAGLAAAYGFGLSSNHPYVDGNKRVAFMAMAVFLGLNGLQFTAEESEVVTTMVALASGALDEPALADWIRSHSAERV
ncbi:MAG: type II toxin-antitoxin system death-on-curing family toxin [Actinobacteria bacterium]|nr:type II toxin-antitoxin system death-on-curing family toxin [Actinomycetota bacterium]MCG2808667.1 type II toxin-antitoxin system death-on-curing family toxin [Coriobacteriia bacterium]